MPALNRTKMSLNNIMITSQADSASRIGPLEHSLLRAMDRSRARVWSMSRASLPTGMTREQARQALSRLAKAGLVERIERGAYLVEPRSGRVPVLPVDLVGAWFEGEPYAVVGGAAAEVHRLTLDTPSIVEVQVARRKGPVHFRGNLFTFPLGDQQSVAVDNTTVKVGQGSCVVASPGKAVVMLLAHESARHAGGPRSDASLVVEMLERGRLRNLWTRTDWRGLVARHANSVAARRLGHLLDQLGIAGSDSLLTFRGAGGNKAFSPLYPPVGPVDTRWRLILNDPSLPSGGRDADTLG